MPPPLPPGAPPPKSVVGPRPGASAPGPSGGAPLPPSGSAGDPRGRISARLAAFLPHRRVSTELPDGADAPHRRRPSSVRRRVESFRAGIHMPHPGQRRSDHFEFAFEEEGVSSEESDIEADTDSTLAESTASANKKKKEGGGLARKIKGGLRGAGATLAHKAEDKKVVQRVMLALFAVCLLWATSYGVARAIVRSRITIPDLSQVSTRNVDAYQGGVSERAFYVECVNIVGDRCQAEYDAQYTLEINRRNAARDFNANLLRTIASNLVTIEDAYNTTQTELDAVTSLPGFPLATYLSGSTAPECSLIVGIVQGQEGAINALNEAKQFQGKAEAQVLSLDLQIRNRQLYDQEFFANKTTELDLLALVMQNNTFNMSKAFEGIGGAFEDFKGCMEFGGSCPRQPVFQGLNDSYNEAVGYFDDLKFRATDYKAKVAVQMTEYAETMSRLRSNFAAIRDSFIPGLVVNIPPQSDSNEPAGFNIAGYTLAGVPLPDSVRSNYATLVAELDAKLGADGADLGGRSDALRENSDGWQDGWDDDYNPPNVTSNQTATDFLAVSAGFVPALTGKLSAISAVTADEREEISGEVNGTQRNLNETSQNLFVKLTNHSEWDLFSYGDEVLADVEGGLQDMSDLLLIFDILFRILHTVFIIRKYWKLTGLATPSGDARVKQDVGAGWGPKKTPLQKLAALATNPLLLTFLTALTISLLLWAFWWAYSPLYYEYVDSCVQNDFRAVDAGTVEGTMLYRNGYEAVFQYSASEGDTLALERTDDINVGRDVECTRQQFNDIVLYNEMVDRYNQLLTRYNEVANQNNALELCLDLNLLDANTLASPSVAPTSFEAQTGDALFDASYAQLDPLAVYNCTNVGGCPGILATNETTDTTLCTGPNEAFLKSVTHEAACSSENWFHAYLFGGFMILSAFILLNIGRIILMRGLVRILWRQVVVNNFSFLASCNDRGEIVYPERVTEKGDSMQVAIREAVKKAIKRWERWGYVIFLSALLIQIPWVWGLTFLADNLEYKRQ